MNFDGKTVVVTGGSRGLGKVTALHFAKHGANVAVNFLSHEGLANEVVDEIKGTGGCAIAVRADVSNEDQVTSMYETVVHELGIPAILVNNAGINIDSTVAKMGRDSWEKVIAVDLSAVFLCTKHVIPHMKAAGWGRIVNVTSVVGQAGVFGTPAYTAAKAGIIGFTKTTARELARKGITVNCVAFGYIEAGMNLRLPENIQKLTLEQIPMGRFGKPEEAAAAILFLASEGAGYITGHALSVNGGFYM